MGQTLVQLLFTPTVGEGAVAQETVSPGGMGPVLIELAKSKATEHMGPMAGHLMDALTNPAQAGNALKLMLAAQEPEEPAEEERGFPTIIECKHCRMPSFTSEYL